MGNPSAAKLGPVDSGGCGVKEEVCSAGKGSAGSPRFFTAPSPLESPLAREFEVGGVALMTEDRWISSLDSWENLPESPVSWLPSLFAECSASRAAPKGLGKLAVWPGELGESSSLISTVVPGW